MRYQAGTDRGRDVRNPQPEDLLGFADAPKLELSEGFQASVAASRGLCEPRGKKEMAVEHIAKLLHSNDFVDRGSGLPVSFLLSTRSAYDVKLQEMACEFCTDSITRGHRGLAALLNSASRTTLAALAFGLALGVALPGEARARAGTVNPVQTSTYSLGTHNPTTLGAGTNINAVSPSNVGVYGGSSMPWTVTNYGRIQGPSGGFDLNSSGSTVTNWGTIGGKAGIGVQLPNGGAVTNESSGSISGYAGVMIEGGVGTVTNAGSITGQAVGVHVASGSVNNELGGTLGISGISALTVYVGHGGSVTNAGTITNPGSGIAAVAIGGGGTVTNSGRISATGTLDAAVYTLGGGTVTNSGTLVVTAASTSVCGCPEGAWSPIRARSRTQQQAALGSAPNRAAR